MIIKSGDHSNTPVGNLANEQSTIGDLPANAPTSIYRAGWNASASSPARMYINLGGNVCVKRISWFDGVDQGNVTVDSGTLGNWTLLTTLTNDLYQQWRRKMCPRRARNIYASSSPGIPRSVRSRCTPASS